MTAELVREIAREIAQEVSKEVSREIAKEAVKDTLTALGIDMNNITKEQEVWAFMRRFHDGTNRGMRAAFTGVIGALATAIVGWLWLTFSNGKPH